MTRVVLSDLWLIVHALIEVDVSRSLNELVCCLGCSRADVIWLSVLHHSVEMIFVVLAHDSCG